MGKQTENNQASGNAYLDVEKERDVKSDGEKDLKKEDNLSQSVDGNFTIEIKDSFSLNTTRQIDQPNDINLVSAAIRVISSEENLNIDEANNFIQSPLVSHSRNTKVKIAASPNAKTLADPASYFRSRINQACHNVMITPGIIDIYKNINIGGFIPRVGDNYAVYNDNMGEIGSEEVPIWNPNKLDQFTRPNVDYDKSLQFSGQLVDLIASGDSNIVRGDNGFVYDDMSTNDKKIRLFSSGIQYNLPSDLVSPSVQGDEHTVQYNMELKKVLKNLEKVSTSDYLNGFSSLAVNPALFRSFVEPAIMLATFLQVMIYSINSAITNQFAVIDRLGIADPYVTYLTNKKVKDRDVILRRFKVLKEILSSIPYNKTVFETYKNAATPYKLLSTDLNHYDNTLISPVLGIQLPLTSFDIKGYHKAATKEYDITDFNVFDSKSNKNAGYTASGQAIPVLVKLGSPLLFLLNCINIKGKIFFNKEVKLTVSATRFTSFMGDFMEAIANDNFRPLIDYLSQTRVLWNYFKTYDIFKDSIFEYSDIQLYDMKFNQTRSDNINVIPRNSSLIAPAFPDMYQSEHAEHGEIIQRVKYYNDLRSIHYSKQVKLLLDQGEYTSEEPTNERTEDGQVITKKFSVKDVIPYLTYASINPIFITEGTKYIPYLGPHGERASDSPKFITLTQGTNRKLSFSPISTVSINPYLLINTRETFGKSSRGLYHVCNFTHDDNNTITLNGIPATPFDDAIKPIIFNNCISRKILLDSIGYHSILGNVEVHALPYIGSYTDRYSINYHVRVQLPEAFDFSDVEYQDLTD